jgi:hypothetical protein
MSSLHGHSGVSDRSTCHGHLVTWLFSHSFSRPSAKRRPSRTLIPVSRSMSYLVPAECLLRICIMAAASLPYIFSQKKQRNSLLIWPAVRRIVRFLRGPFLPGARIASQLTVCCKRRLGSSILGLTWFS